tara:strand:- start:373 stop:981 length:609 start_codon:yes stop_codon:yes gene_type:complete
MDKKKYFLHVGCGYSNIENTPFDKEEWHEIRYDIDPVKSPDILGSIVNIKAIKDNSLDAIYSSHNIEHLYSHEVKICLKEFRRVLKENSGFAVITCPDIQQICEMIGRGKLNDTAYESVIGAITPFDILYGNSKSIEEGNLHMAHHCGFTENSLAKELAEANFIDIAIMKRAKPPYDIWTVATCFCSKEGQLKALADTYFPN